MGDEKKVEWYLCKLKPEGEYFFGGERTFDFHGEGGKKTEEKNDYYIRSEKCPSQSTLLGTLRFLVLKKEGKLSDKGVPNKDTTKLLIGPESFSISDQNELSFGKIIKITPLMLMDSKGNRLIRTPFNHNKSENYKPFLMSGPYKTQLGDNIWLPKDFNVKEGLADNFYDIDENRIIKDSDDFQMFSSHEHTRIKKREENNKKNEGGFFKKLYMSLNNEYVFSFYCLAEEGALPEKSTVYMGQDKSLFLFTSELIKKSDPMKEMKERISKLEKPKFVDAKDQDAIKVYYALSDVLQSENYQNCYSMVRKKWFRSMVTTNCEKNQFRDRKKKSRLYQLFEAGSVFFIDADRNDETSIAEKKDNDKEGLYKEKVLEKNLNTIGMNILVEIGGKKDE